MPQRPRWADPEAKPRLKQYSVDLNDGSTTKPCTVHRLVAEASIDRGPFETDIDHLDGVTTHHCVTNLQFRSRVANILAVHQIRLDLRRTGP
jgi:hypothetical protein